MVTVTTAAAALALIEQGEHFDVILSDLMMPDMTGMDLHRELLAVAPEHATRMVFLSGGAFTPRARSFLDTVPNHCLDKPIDIRQLRAVINDRVK